MPVLALCTVYACKLVEKALKCKTKNFFNFIFLYEKFSLYSYKEINEAEQCKSSNHYSI